MDTPHLAASQADVLYWLVENDGDVEPEHPRYFTKQLAEELDHSTSTISNAIRRLEERGLVNVSRSNDDGGYVHRLKVTIAGEQAARSPYLGLTANEVVLAWLAHNNGVCTSQGKLKPSGIISRDELVPFDGTSISTAIKTLYESGQVIANVSEYEDRRTYDDIALSHTLLQPPARQTTVDEHIAEAEAHRERAPTQGGAAHDIAAELLRMVVDKLTEPDEADAWREKYTQAQRDLKAAQDELELARKALYEERRRNETLQQELLEHGARNKVDYDESTLEKLKKLMTQTGAER